MKAQRKRRRSPAEHSLLTFGLSSFYFLLFTLFFGFAQAQQPSHFALGEDELSGTDVYDILQDRNGIYWLATDEGLIRYDGYSFTPLNCEAMLGNSVFNLQLDKQNNVVCHNLSGQFFKVENGICAEFFRIPEELMSNDIRYVLDHEDKLNIATNALFRVEKDGETRLFRDGAGGFNSFSDMLAAGDSLILSQNHGPPKILTLKKDQLKEKRFDPGPMPGNTFVQPFLQDGKVRFFERGSGSVSDPGRDIHRKEFIPGKKPGELLRHQTTRKHLWIARQTGGVQVFDTYLQPLFGGEVLFRNAIISTVCEDAAGNILLGTLGEGIIVINNLDLSLELGFSSLGKITRISSTASGEIFLGTQDGKVYRHEEGKGTQLFHDGQTKNIELLEHLDLTGELLLAEDRPVFIHEASGKIKRGKSGSAKDLAPIPGVGYLIAANNGFILYDVRDMDPLPEIPMNIEVGLDPRLKATVEIRGRYHCIGYDPSTTSIFAGSPLGLKIFRGGKAEVFRYRDQPLMCNDFAYWQGKMYVATQKQGLFIFENDELRGQIGKPEGIFSNAVRQLLPMGDTLLLTTDKGLQAIDPKGELIFSLSTSEGLASKNILDVEVCGEKLWLATQKGLQTMPLSAIRASTIHPSVSIKSIYVNDSLTAESSGFAYNENKFTFELAYPELKYRNEASYQYKLEGIDPDWQFNDYFDNRIEYKSLPPGDYTFKVKSVCRNSESKMASFQFSISDPFWRTWWFYTLIATGFLGLTYAIYKRESLRQKRKIRQENRLNASRLTAIQSQMNPHFIFNALNSIQELVLQQDASDAYSYITKFAKLVRHTLNYSDKNFIDFESEAELLELYLSLEKLRFEDDFDYEINVTGVDNIKVPPMLVQPFAENALKHGLLHREGLKKLSIDFELGEFLTCTITDNGVGRKRSMEIKKRQSGGHRSFSVNAMQQRFEILRKVYGEELGFEYVDLEEDGKAAGTKVILRIPVKRMF